MQRLGHVVLQTNRYVQALDWYLEHLGLIVSDFLYYPGQRERGPVMSFIRCDRGPTPTDHHTLAMALGPANRYVHSAYQVCRPRRAGRRRGVPARARLPPLVGDRPAHPGQPDLRLLARPGRVPGRALQRRRPVRQHPRAGLGPDGGVRPAQWGPPADARTSWASTPAGSPCRSSRAIARALRDDTEFDLPALRGLLGANAHPEGGDVMSISVLRTADAWYVQTPRAAPPASTPTPPPPPSCWPTGGDRAGRGDRRHACRSTT